MNGNPPPHGRAIMLSGGQKSIGWCAWAIYDVDVSNLELEPGNPEYQPVIDRRPRVPEPLPVRLVAIGPVRLPAPMGVAAELDAFYAGMLGLERIPREIELIYRAENYE